MGMGDVLGGQGGMREGADGGMVKGRGMRIANCEEEESRGDEGRRGLVVADGGRVMGAGEETGHGMWEGKGRKGETAE